MKPLTLDGIELRHVRLPLVAPFTTSFGTETHRDVILVRAASSAGEGWGECVAEEAPLYLSEYNAAAWDVMTRFLIPALLDAGELTPARVGAILEPFVGHRMAKGALEMAILDLSLRAAGVSFADHLGVMRDRVPSGVSVGIQDTIDDLVSVVRGYLDEGYVRIKIKIKPGWDIEPTRVLRETFGDIPLQVDANAAYTLADATHLARLDEFGLLLIEQPLHNDDLRQHAELATQLRTPICLDESIVSARAAADAIAMGAARIINIKPGRVGGYLEAVRIHDLARAHGIAVWCGGMLETGIGRPANASLAALPGFTLPGDISASSRFYAEDIATPVVIEDGHVAVSRAPGLSGTPIPDRLDAATVRSEWVSRT